MHAGRALGLHDAPAPPRGGQRARRLAVGAQEVALAQFPEFQGIANGTDPATPTPTGVNADGKVE